MTFDTSRALALSGAQLLCNSINSFAIDQSHLHDPARAFENNVFLATANKIGSLVPQKNPQEQRFISQEDLASTSVGAGQSQIVSCDGKVLAKLNNNEEGFAFADIDLAGPTAERATGTKVGLNNKFRPDGTQLIKQLRPELYQALTAQIKQAQLMKKTPLQANKVPVTANVAIFATYKSNEHAIEDVCQYIENNLTDIIQLPELFFIADKTITNDVGQRDQIACLSQQLIEQVSAVLRPFQYLCTSLVIEGIHQAVLISEQGLLATQAQLHFCKRYQWTELGDELNIIELPLEQGNISLAMLTADDANIPELVKVTALSGIHLLLVPFDIQEPCEVEYSLLSRAAENRICIVAASREKSFANDLATETATNNIYGKNKVKAQKSTGLIANLTTDPALLPQWKTQKFNGYINQPLVKLQYGKITKAVIHPIAACTKRLN
jgi:Predicted amidohydrolase